MEAVTLESLARVTPGKVTSGRSGFLFAAGDSNDFRCINRLVHGEHAVFALRRDVKVGRQVFLKGSFFVPNRDDVVVALAKLAKELGTDFVGVDRSPGSPGLALRELRIGLFDVYGGDIATGWTRWLLERYEFPFAMVHGARIHAGGLRDSYDVLVFQTGLPDPGGRGRIRRALRRGRPNRIGDDDLRKMVAALPPFEDWSDVESRRVRLTREKATPALREFVEAGGVLVAVGSQAVAAARLFELPVEDGVLVRDAKSGRDRAATRKEFFIPASLLRMTPSESSMVTTGLPKSINAMFRRSSAFRVKDDPKVKVLARFPKMSDDLLVSGWAIGADLLRGRTAAIEAKVGKGKLYLFATDVTYRGQPQATIKMFFNSIMLGAAAEVPTSEVK